MRHPEKLMFVFGLFVHTCLTKHVETNQQGHKSDGNDKKISKREYYAPEYNHEKYSYPAYRFEYGVHDPQSGDIKKQYEERDGDQVRGYYSLMEPDGAIRLVEYTADAKNGFQAVVKRFGQSQHPTVTYHMNTAAAGGGEGGQNYAPSYHSGEHQYHGSRGGPQQQQHQQHHREPPAHHHQLPAHHYEPPAHHYEPPAHHYEPPAHHFEPPAHHYEPPAHHFEPPAHQYEPPAHQYEPPAHQYEPPAHHYEPPAHHYEPSAHHYKPAPAPAYDHYQHGPPVPVRPAAALHRPDASGFDDRGAVQPLFAAGLEPATVHGDFGSASPDRYQPAPLQFPAENGFWHGVKDDEDDDAGGGVHRVGLDEYQHPAADDGDEESQRYAGDGDGDGEGDGAAADRPEYLRKYFEPDYRGRDEAAADERGENDEDESK